LAAFHDATHIASFTHPDCLSRLHEVVKGSNGISHRYDSDEGSSCGSHHPGRESHLRGGTGGIPTVTSLNPAAGALQAERRGHSRHRLHRGDRRQVRHDRRGSFTVNSATQITATAPAATREPRWTSPSRPLSARASPRPVHQVQLRRAYHHQAGTEWRFRGGSTSSRSRGPGSPA